MSKTDIYTQREQMPQAEISPQPSQRRRRSSSRRAFDQHDRRRRSTNSGARRMLHLFRKEKNEKRLWIGMLIVIVTLLVVTALWQFWYLDYVARKEEQKKVLHMPPAQSSVPAPSAAE